MAVLEMEDPARIKIPFFLGRLSQRQLRVNYVDGEYIAIIQIDENGGIKLF